MEWLFHKVNLGFTVLIHLKKAPDGMIVPAPEIENIQVRCLFCTRDRPPGRQISRNDDDLYPTCHCICTEDRWEFYQLVEKIWTRGRRPPNFFNVQHCLSRIFGTAKWRLAHNSDQEPMLPKSHTPQDNVIVWQICLFISLKIVKTQRLMRSVSNGRNRVKFTQSERQKL